MSQALPLHYQQSSRLSWDSLSYKLSLRKVTTGLHTLKVEAKDAAGNIGSQTIQVSK